MSDFLNFTDEIIDGQPKYNITNNQDGTKNIELANEVIQQGTALSKVGMNRLNAVLGYNETSVNEVPVYSPTGITDFSYQSALTNSDTSWSVNDSFGAINVVMSSFTDAVLGTYTPEMRINSSKTFTATSSVDTSHTAVWTEMTNGGINYTNTHFLNHLNRGASYKYNTFHNRNSSLNLNLSFKIDFKNELEHFISLTATCATELMSGNGVLKIEESDDGINWNSRPNWETTIRSYAYDYGISRHSLGNKRFIKITDLTAYDMKITTLFFSSRYYEENKSINFETQDVATNFKNNEVIEINTPNFDTTDVVQNTFNTISVDTLLQPNKYYELLYDETNDRFIAEEARNAN